MESHIVKEEPTIVASGQEHFDYEAISTTVSKIVDISALTQPASNETEDGISDKVINVFFMCNKLKISKRNLKLKLGKIIYILIKQLKESEYFYIFISF